MSDAPILTLALTPRGQEAIKPAELIQVTGHHELTLNARRAITVLWHHAHMQGVGEGKRYTVEIDELKPTGHKGYEMVEEAIEALMRTLLVVRLPNGKTRRVQFLGGNDLDSPDRPAGVLTYSFDAMLIEILQKSTIWGKIALPIIMSFSSKYSVSLYENVAQVANLSFKTQLEYTLEEFRSMLGVPPGRYKTFGELNLHVLKPAVAEVNALAPFDLAVLPVKQGKKVVKVSVGWFKKSDEELQAAFRERQASKIGRRARIAGRAEHVLSPMPSQDRIRRRAPKISLLGSQ
ncbi:replication initiation protein [Roseomonas sp. SSH11]|uniref:Replication initiation protein n=1 Tax=Pararoseomonas baculiformis TaxID=2820812 RepID=A0ABS4AL44_9PROT|nr:replication initiation protein [Pararoseomonas baculiformis]MBP0447741.1 replication initiation protein [Pararoseomonas baculiformis]